MTTHPEIDPITARSLHNTGLSWRKVGIILAQMAGRPVAFQGRSIWHAVSKAKKA